MKKLSLILAGLLLLSFSCKDQEKSEGNLEKDDSYSESEYNTSSPENQAESSQASGQTSGEREREKSETAIAEIGNDTYLKKGEENDYDCRCYCLQVNLAGTAELCLAQDKIYIDASFKKSADGINVYYVQPSAKNTNKDLPWKKFDKDQPIAVITPTEEGLELDWKGFSINGELALDYAIYGKKTLEGKYKRK